MKVSPNELSAAVDSEKRDTDTNMNGDLSPINVGQQPMEVDCDKIETQSLTNSLSPTMMESQSNKVIAAMRCKEEGNRFFVQKKFENAHDSYQQGLNHLLSKEESASLSLQVALLSNSAITSNKLSLYERAQNECTKALKLIAQKSLSQSQEHPETSQSPVISPSTHAKVWYRRAHAREYLGLWNEALDDLEQTFSILQKLLNTEQTSATTINDVQQMMTRIKDKQRQRQPLSSFDNTSKSTNPNHTISSAKKQKYIILQLLQQNTTQQQQIRNKPILPGEAFFLINFHWWKHWCEYVDLFNSSDHHNIGNLENSHDEKNKKSHYDYILSLLPLGAYFPSPSTQPSTQQQQSRRRSSTSSMDEDDESSSTSSISTRSSFDMKNHSQSRDIDTSNSSHHQSPGVIDNSSLLYSPSVINSSQSNQTVATTYLSEHKQTTPGQSLRTNLVRGHHYEILPREVYAALRCWYGERTAPICFRAQQYASENNSTTMSILLYPHLQSAENQQTENIHKTKQLQLLNGTATSTCSACRSTQAQSRCTKCKAVYYCGRGCQASHWPYHERLCKALSKHSVPIPKESKLLSRLGRVGLKNLGNTCFMNSALQCLSHAFPLTRHFLSTNFQNDLNTLNVMGTSGKLADAYNSLLKELWMGNKSSYSPIKLKGAVSVYAAQFADGAQHDAQEFLAFLLDGLNEDLNRIQNPPYVKMPEVTECKKLTVAGAEAWDAHCRRYDSLVTENFYGQFQSTCICPQCKKVAIKFETFNHISLEIPSHQSNRTIVVYLFDSIPIEQIQNNTYDDSTLNPPMRYGITIPKNASIGDLKNALSKLCGIPSSRLALCYIYRNNVYEILNENKPVASIKSGDEIAAYNVDSFQSKSIHAIITHHQFMIESKSPNLGPTKKSITFGFPLMVSFHPNITCRQVWDLVWKYTSFATRDSNKVISSEKLSRILTIRVTDNHGNPRPIFRNLSGDSSYLSEDSDPESILPRMSNENIANYMGEGFTENFMFLRLEWKTNYKPINVDPTSFSKFDDHSSTSALTDDHSSSNAVTLDNCFANFTRPEKLDDFNKWYCSSCKMHVRAMKTMKLWKLPNILIIHLKRFKFPNSLRREKLDTYVNFPIDGLDMSKHCASMLHNFGDKEFVVDYVPAKYDLFAVSNHHGGISFGHYTAFARRWNEELIQNEWAKFDDFNVQPIGCGAGHVVSSDAYVLFYRRRTFT